MIIRGILDRSLSNQICIRGFARIKELARISKANPEYQRELLEKQKDVVSNFLTEETYLFFPEVILSLKLRQDLNLKGAYKDATAIQLIEKGKDFNSNIDKLKIRSKVFPQENFDVNETNQITVVEVEFDDAELAQLIQDNKHPLHRIDGNHRLTAAEEIVTDRIGKMNIPFCIVLFEETFEDKFNPASNKMEKTSDTSFEKFEKVVFYNINSKTEPLTLEQNLRVIINDEKHFDEVELEKIFGRSGVLVRKLYNQIEDVNLLKGINHLLHNNFRGLSKSIFESLLGSKAEDELVSEVKESLLTINELYKSQDKLKGNNSEGLFTALLYYNVKDKPKYNFFKEWVLKHHIFEIQEAKYKTLIDIFDKVSDQTVKIFVAMPYFSEDEVESYNQAYKRVLDKIKAENDQIKISLFDIMQHKGDSYNINNKMIEQINESNIFIADISNRNVNVAFELGYAKNDHNKSVVMIKRESDETRTPFDYEQDMCHKYKEKAIHTLEEIVFANIKDILLKRGFTFNAVANV
jgi:nucleoside 2-deoxyribosyltransferase